MHIRLHVGRHCHAVCLSTTLKGNNMPFPLRRLQGHDASHDSNVTLTTGPEKKVPSKRKDKKQVHAQCVLVSPGRQTQYIDWAGTKCCSKVHSVGTG